MIKVEKIREKHDILTVEEKWIALILIKTKIIIEITPTQRYLGTRQLKASSMRIIKHIEKET